MGSCGGGDAGGEFKLPGPDGSVYVVQRYAGCQECRSPAGVVIYKMLLLDGDAWGAREIPDLALGQDGGGDTDGDGEILIPVANAEEFAPRLRPWLEEHWEEYLDIGDEILNVDQLAHLVEDGLMGTWTEIIHASMKWEALLNKEKT